MVAACVLRPGDARRLDGLTDSKLLTAAAREQYYELIVRRCADSAVVVIPPTEIDRRGCTWRTSRACDAPSRR